MNTFLLLILLSGITITNSFQDAPVPPTSLTETHTSIQTVNIPANRIVLHTFEELMADSDFVGIIESDRDFTAQKPEITYTEDDFLESFATRSQVRVLKTLHGETPKAWAIDIIEPAAMVPINGESYLYTIDEYIPLKPHTPYIVFLKKNSNGDLAIANMNESVFFQKVADEQKFTSEFMIKNPDREKIYADIITQWWTE